MTIASLLLAADRATDPHMAKVLRHKAGQVAAHGEYKSRVPLLPEAKRLVERAEQRIRERESAS